VIGKSSKPRCFKDGKKLPVNTTRIVKHGWWQIFCSFLHYLDTQMGAQKNKKKFKRFSMRTV
jgi:hypothetical protein